LSANDNSHRGLLPPGLGDMLPPEAELEAHVTGRLMARFAGQGYQRVKPPLVEYEDSLFGGAGVAMAAHSFRLMDPVSQRMMAVRADMTLQVARIATTRLKDAPRPLRLSYAGNVLRMKGSQLRPQRQFAQVGVELIGSDAATADAEAVLLAADALLEVGVPALSVDLNLPTLVTALCAALSLPDSMVRRLRRALERKEESAMARIVADERAKGVAAASDAVRDVFVGLLRAVGPAEEGVARLKALALPPAARAEADRLADVVALLHEAAPSLHLTIDPVEYRGLEYQDGVSFTLYARGALGEVGRGELGRGGRYRAGFSEDEGTASEPATGFTLYMDTVLGAATVEPPGKRLYVPADVAWVELARWRDEGFHTVHGLAQVADMRAEAARLGCAYALIDGKAVAI